ncbi:MAG: hypothetical protein K5872_04285 [Rhizobiaceae bacterium]|nr:hypothetical protein [Rhizobiaceae bacterium]MCV0405429.1 hypothetical protein [Rhizobiaceae bacterium]
MTRRSARHFDEMIRPMLAVALAFGLFVGSVHVARNGLATPAFASAASEIGVVQKKSNGIGFVLLVGLQRG